MLKPLHSEFRMNTAELNYLELVYIYDYLKTLYCNVDFFLFS